MSAAEKKVSKTIRVAGLLVLAGATLGTTLGVYALLNPWLLSSFIDISQYEATPFFLGFHLPSLVIMIALGYVFATTQRLERLDLWHVTPLCVSALLCVILSALSPFNILSFLGGFLALNAVVFAQTKPAFKTLWKREARFLVEAGSLLVASSSSLFLLMLFISRIVSTYSPGFAAAEAYYLYALFIMEMLSFLAFFAISSFCSRGAHSGLCGMLGIVAGVTFSVIAIQNQYFYTNASAYLGAFLVSAGIAFTLFGALIYLKLFLSQMVSSVVLTPSFLFRGKYCPNCGAPWTDPARAVCSSCGQSWKLRPEVPFCPYCGRLVAKGVQTCPHCKEDVGSLPVHYSLRKVEKKEMWSVDKGSSVKRALRTVSKQVPLTFREFVYVIILTFAFVFVSFIAYVRTETHPYMAGFFIVHYGFPFEWLQVLFAVGYAGKPEVSLIALGLNLAFYFVVAFFVVLGFTKLADYMRA